MSFVVSLILTVQILCALGMIGLILMQHGKGADMGASFGSGSAGSLFGSAGSANFLSRTTAVLASVFFVATLALAYFGNLRPQDSGAGVMSGAAAPAAAASAAASAAAAQIPAQTASTAVPATAGSAPPAAASSAPASGKASDIPK